MAEERNHWMGKLVQGKRISSLKFKFSQFFIFSQLWRLHNFHNCDFAQFLTWGRSDIFQSEQRGAIHLGCMFWSRSERKTFGHEVREKPPLQSHVPWTPPRQSWLAYQTGREGRNAPQGQTGLSLLVSLSLSLPFPVVILYLLQMIPFLVMW